VTVSKACDGFVMVRQLDKINMFKGEHNIFFMVAMEDGEKIKRVDKGTMVCRSGAPINLNVITAECDFPRSKSYPYKFTLLVANTKSGEEGSGKFQVSVYAKDDKIKIKQLSIK
jgi:hypothetical protein